MSEFNSSYKVRWLGVKKVFLNTMKRVLILEGGVADYLVKSDHQLDELLKKIEYYLKNPNGSQTSKE